MARDRVAEMEWFVRVVEAGSFSAAAVAFGATQSFASKQVAQLEARLGVRLLNRTTRSVSLTEAGASFYDRCRALLLSVEEAEAEARLGQGAVHGLLRVNTSAILATSLVQPALLAFRDQHPMVRIEITIDDRRIDPIEEGIDLVVRTGALRDSQLHRRRAGTAPIGLFASPGYLARRGHPTAATELGGHELIGVPARGGSGARRAGALRSPDLDRFIGTPIAVGSAVLGRDAALAGAGIAILPLFAVRDDVAAGRLIAVLPEPKIGAMEVSFVHPYGRQPPRKVTAFLDFATARWRRAGELR